LHNFQKIGFALSYQWISWKWTKL